MNALDNILNRVSARNLIQPHPDKNELEIVYKAALRAPDHAWLRPSRFIEVSGDSISKLSNIFEDYSLTLNDITAEVAAKYKNAPFRAPMIIILVSSYKEHPKVPALEQKLSTAAAAQNIMLALNAMKYSAIWRTGKLAFNRHVSNKLGLEDTEEILGYLYVGTPDGKNKNVPELDIDNFVTRL